MNRWIKRQRGWRLFAALWLWFALWYAVMIAFIALGNLVALGIGPVHGGFPMPYWVPPLGMACGWIPAAVMYRRFGRERAGPDTNHDHAGH